MISSLGGLLIALLFLLPGYVAFKADSQFKRPSGSTELVAETLLLSAIGHGVVLTVYGLTGQLNAFLKLVGAINRHTTLDALASDRGVLLHYYLFVILASAFWSAFRINTFISKALSWVLSAPTTSEPLWKQLFQDARIAKGAALVNVLLTMKDGRQITGTVQMFDLRDDSEPKELVLSFVLIADRGRVTQIPADYLVVNSADVAMMNVQYWKPQAMPLGEALRFVITQRRSLTELLRWIAVLLLPATYGALRDLAVRSHRRSRIWWRRNYRRFIRPIVRRIQRPRIPPAGL